VSLASEIVGHAAFHALNNFLIVSDCIEILEAGWHRLFEEGKEEHFLKNCMTKAEATLLDAFANAKSQSPCYSY
jgi:hypothetical protein